jgi:hypothetical protein
LDAVLHVDTGMNRLGLPRGTGDPVGGTGKRLAGLNLVLVMSHLACADEPDNKNECEQLSRFRQALAMLPPRPPAWPPAMARCWAWTIISIWCGLVWRCTAPTRKAGRRRGAVPANLMQTAAV